MTNPLKAAGQLVLPRQCAGCGLWDTDLCPQCRQLLSRSATLLNSDLLPATDLAIWSQGTYAGALRQIVLSFKSGRHRAITGAVLAGINNGAAAMVPWLTCQLASDKPLAIINAPSKLSRRWHANLVARQLAQGLADFLAPQLDIAVVSADPLRLRSGKQLGKSSRQRAQRQVQCLADATGWQVVLVDDVVTTGSTLEASAKALEAAGASSFAPGHWLQPLAKNAQRGPKFNAKHDFAYRILAKIRVTQNTIMYYSVSYNTPSQSLVCFGNNQGGLIQLWKSRL